MGYLTLKDFSNQSSKFLILARSSKLFSFLCLLVQINTVCFQFIWHFAVFEIDNNDNMQVTCMALRTTRVSQNNRHGNVCQKALYVHYNKKYVQTDMTVILCNKKYTLKLTFHQINFLGKGMPVINSRLLVLISFPPKGCNKNLITKTPFPFVR